MTIRYTVTKRDLVQAQMRSLLHQPVLLLIAGVAGFIFVSSVVGLPQISQGTFAGKLIAGLLAAAVVVVLLVVFGLIITLLLVFSQRNRGVLGEHTLTITESGLRESTRFNESRHRWDGIHRMVRTRSLLLIYVTDTLFHVVSRSRPLLEGDLAAFEASLQKQLRPGGPTRPADAR